MEFRFYSRAEEKRPFFSSSNETKWRFVQLDVKDRNFCGRVIIVIHTCRTFPEIGDHAGESRKSFPLIIWCQTHFFGEFRFRFITISRLISKNWKKNHANVSKIGFEFSDTWENITQLHLASENRENSRDPVSPRDCERMIFDRNFFFFFFYLNITSIAGFHLAIAIININNFVYLLNSRWFFSWPAIFFYLGL